MKRIKAGIIGLGVGEKHIDGYQRHPDCEVVALCDFSDEKYAMAKEKYANLRITSNANDILDDPEINVVSIASYDNYHCEQILQALNSEKHVFVEKPLCLFVHEAKSIRELLNSKPELQLSSNLVLRTCPRFVRVKEAIESGEMGDIYSIQLDYLWGRRYKLTDGWRKDMDFYSIVLGAAVHMIDLLIWFTNMLPIEVKAYGNHIATKNSEMKHNDFAAILLKYETGLIAEVSAHGGCMHPHFHDVRVFGTNKSFINGFAGGLWVNSDDQNVQPISVKEEYPGKSKRRNAITTFIDSIINENVRPVIATDEVFNTMSVCFAAEEAMQSNKTVSIEYI